MKSLVRDEWNFKHNAITYRSQRRFNKIGVMCSCFLEREIRRAAAFWTCCNFFYLVVR